MLFSSSRLVFGFEDAEGFNDAVDNGLGPGGAAGHVDVDGDDGIDAAGDVVAVAKNAAAGGADADGDDDFGFGELVIDVTDDFLALFVDGPGDDEDVGVFGVAGVDDAKAFDVVERREAGECFDVAAVAA
jgi:hypothetical protein